MLWSEWIPQKEGRRELELYAYVIVGSNQPLPIKSHYNG